ncbi:hypothetical protein C8J56DRAFT_1173076 [Mycena floridula]|nr:hypothetical protein C8J56DRAFT_1173076 [Mycena floridula]
MSPSILALDRCLNLPELRRSRLFNKDGSTVDRGLDTELAYGSEPMLVLIHISRRHCLAISRFAQSLVTVAFESSITRCSTATQLSRYPTHWRNRHRVSFAHSEDDCRALAVSPS